MQKIKISPSKFDKMMKDLATQINNVGTKEYDGIFPIPRGGLAMALWLSHRLDLPIVTELSINTLVVDDISDTGKTLQFYKKLGNDIACLFTSDWTKSEPTFWLENKLEKDSWIVFPWENAKTENTYSKGTVGVKK